MQLSSVNDLSLGKVPRSPENHVDLSYNGLPTRVKVNDKELFITLIGMGEDGNATIN